MKPGADVETLGDLAIAVWRVVDNPVTATVAVHYIASEVLDAIKKGEIRHVKWVEDNET